MQIVACFLISHRLWVNLPELDARHSLIPSSLTMKIILVDSRLASLGVASQSFTQQPLEAEQPDLTASAPLKGLD